MQNSLPALRHICAAEEAALGPIFAQIAAAFAPPFTAQLRSQINALLDAAEPHRHALQRNHSFHLHNPDLRALPMHAPERLYFDAVLRHLRLYTPAVTRLQTALKARPAPLFPTRPPYAPDAQLLALHARTWDRMHAHLSPRPPNLYHDAPGHHGDLPLHSTVFLDYCMAARRLCLAMGKPGAFLDIGCGAGLKVLQACEFFARADGLEYEPDHAQAAQGLLARAGWPHSKIFHADALTFPDYAAYDVLYAYKPMYGEALEIMEQRLTQHAQPNTLLIAPYLDFTTRFETLGCQRIERFLYIIRPDRSLPKLIKTAKQVGSCLPVRPKNGYAEDGFLAPLHLALRHWGHGD